MTAVEVAVVLAAVAVGATVKSVTGMGLPIIAIPVIALVTSTETAVVLIAVPNVVQNVALVTRNTRHRHETVALGRLVATGIVGAMVGSLLLGVVAEEVALSVLLVVLVFYVITSLRRPDLHVSRDAAHRWAPAIGALGGLFQGGIGISGPIVGTWHHALGITRGAFVLSVSTIFLITGATQVGVLASTGKLEGHVGVVLAVTVLVLATVPLGQWLRDRLSGRGFDRAVIGMLAASTVGVSIDLARSLAGS